MRFMKGTPLPRWRLKCQLTTEKHTIKDQGNLQIEFSEITLEGKIFFISLMNVDIVIKSGPQQLFV